MEVQDILKKRHKNPKLSLENAAYSIPDMLLQKLTTELLKGFPFAYLLEQAEFYGHHFFVNNHVLIPRPETEQLVDLIVQERKVYSDVLDVGTGSGVILLSLLKANVVFEGLGVDLSPGALNVAATNAHNLRLNQRTEFRLSDRFQNVSEKFELIVSNPPYIKVSSHKSLVHQQVDQHEPHMALYLPDSDYEKWFERFFIEIKSHLKPGGLFMMEGHELEVERQAEVLLKLGFGKVQVLKDYSGSLRFLKARVQ